MIFSMFPTKRLNPVAGKLWNESEQSGEVSFPTKRLNPVAGKGKYAKGQPLEIKEFPKKRLNPVAGKSIWGSGRA